MEKHIKERRAEYQRLLADPDYKNVRFDEKTGGIKATHVGHNTEDDKIVAFGMTSPQLETECQEVGYRLGHSFILRNEKLYRQGTKLLENSTQMDAEVDGRIMEIRSITKDLPFYRNALKVKNRHLKHFNREHGENANTVILYFHDARMYSRERLDLSIEKLKDIDAVDKDGNLLGRKSLLWFSLFEIETQKNRGGSFHVWKEPPRGKNGSHLLSRIALQYHRRRRA